jgi:hypothetical protein
VLCCAVPLQLLYLSDVYDHISTVVEDMISLAEDAKDLIDLVRLWVANTATFLL